MTLDGALRDFVVRTAAVAVGVADVDTGRIWSAGPTAREDVRWIYGRAFGSADAVSDTVGYLEGKILPQLIGQGTAYGALSRSGKWLHGVFFVTPEATRVVEAYRTASKLSSELAVLLQAGSND